MDELLLLALSLSIFLFSLCFYQQIIKKQGSSSPPGPWGLPFLGYLPFLNVNLHIQLTEMAKKYGPIFQLRIGTKNWVVISSPALVKEVIREKDAIFANRDPPVAAILATGGEDIVWSPYGPYWRNMRKFFVREMLSKNNLQASYPLRKEEVRKVIRDVKSSKVGKPINIGELVFMTELKVLMSLVWGGKMETTKQEEIGVEFRDKFLKLVDLLGKPNISDLFPSLARFDVQGVAKEMKHTLVSIEAILDSIIDDRMKMEGGLGVGGTEGSTTKDFLGILLELKEHQPTDAQGPPFGLTQIKAILKDILVGGTDTTATIVEWVMSELLDKPHVMKKVQQELVEVVGENSIVEESHLSKLSYLDAVMKESFRLHPPLPFLVPRRPSQCCQVGGYTIAKDSQMFLNMWSIYRDPQNWENPSEFNPDRFLNESASCDYTGNNVEYLPFGGGRRICPGLPLAEKMMMYFVGTLVHSFEWRLPQGETIDMSENFGIVMRKGKPLLAIPYQRLSDPDMYS